MMGKAGWGDTCGNSNTAAGGCLQDHQELGPFDKKFKNTAIPALNNLGFQQSILFLITYNV